MRWFAVAAAVALMLAAAPSAEAQVKSCGDLQLFIRNPDVQPQGDGKFHVTGDFFMQFQVIGAGADEIETFAFSVGLPVDNPEQICDLPVWPGGLMLEAYKADENKNDGFFILMTTGGSSTPQNIDLSVAVHGYDAAGNELARFWSTAIVETCEGTQGGCPQDMRVSRDVVQPWPIILPGDGAESLVDGFTVEFAEELSELSILLNNEDVTDDMVETAGRTWDRDVFWDYGPRGLIGTAVPMCTLDGTPGDVQSCGPADGPAYEWTERSMTADDVIRVEARDLAGNLAVKEIHIGSSVASGAIDDGIPILQMTFDEPTLTVAPGETAIFKMRMENTGSGEGHPFADAAVPEGWAFEWVPGHQPVPAGGNSEQELHVTAPVNAVDDDYTVEALVEYRQGSQDKILRSVLTTIIETPEDFQIDAVDDGAEAKKSPVLGPAVLILLLLGAVVRTRI